MSMLVDRKEVIYMKAYFALIVALIVMIVLPMLVSAANAMTTAGAAL